jgi:pyridoxamine 5'-phosphate oxidase
VAPEAITADPIVRFETLFARARAAGEVDPSVHVLATAADGQPAARCLLLKEVTGDGFVFFTNYRSRKGIDLAGNPRAALCFHWPRLGAVVTVEGRVARLTPAESDAYFAQRPRGSRLGAWASRQSAPLPSRVVLIVRWLAFALRFLGRCVPRPEFWGGFRLHPHRVDIVHRGADGLTERSVYRQRDGRWDVETVFEWT